MTIACRMGLGIGLYGQVRRKDRWATNTTTLGGNPKATPTRAKALPGRRDPAWSEAVAGQM